MDNYQPQNSCQRQDYCPCLMRCNDGPSIPVGEYPEGGTSLVRSYGPVGGTSDGVGQPPNSR